MKQLDSKAVWLFFLPYAIVLSIFLLPVIFGTILASFEEPWMWVMVLILISPYIILYVWARLIYHFYKYELTADSFKKEYGIIWKKYVSIPYERIQNVDIHRGLLARLLGVSDLFIQTAGMSAVVRRNSIGGGGAEGRLPGISKEEAEQMRDDLIRRAKGGRTEKTQTNNTQAGV